MTRVEVRSLVARMCECALEDERVAISNTPARNTFQNRSLTWWKAADLLAREAGLFALETPAALLAWRERRRERISSPTAKTQPMKRVSL